MQCNKIPSVSTRLWLPRSARLIPSKQRNYLICKIDWLGENWREKPLIKTQISWCMKIHVTKIFSYNYSVLHTRVGKKPEFLRPDPTWIFEFFRVFWPEKTRSQKSNPTRPDPEVRVSGFFGYPTRKPELLSTLMIKCPKFHLWCVCVVL